MKKHVLVIGDDIQVIHYFTEAFVQTDAGYKCTVASNIPQALQMLEFLSPDVLFINLEPDIGPALELVRSLKHDKKLKSIKIIAFAKQIEFYTSICKGYGADGAILPPSSVHEILDALDGLASDEPVSAATGSKPGAAQPV